MIRAESPPVMASPTGRDHRRDGTITTHYTRRPAPRNTCQHCGAPSWRDVCRQCAAWIRFRRHHEAATAALREVPR